MKVLINRSVGPGLDRIRSVQDAPDCITSKIVFYKSTISKNFLEDWNPSVTYVKPHSYASLSYLLNLLLCLKVNILLIFRLFGKGIFCYPNPRAALFLQTSQSTFQYNGKPYSILLQVRVDPLKYTIQYERLNTTKFEVLEVDDKAAIRPYGICLFPAKIHEKAIASINNQQLNSSLVQTYDCATGTCAPQINVIKYAHLLDSLYDYDFTREKDVTPKYIGNKQYLRPYGCLRLGIKVKGKYENEEWLSTTWHNAYHGTRPEYVTCILENGFKKSVKGSYGPGVYCTPNPKEALRYAILKKSTFNYKGIDYYVVLQTRVDPSKYKVVCGNDINKQYWLLGDENGIRAYAICLFPK
uniref:PARP catalytic domain-containing protein n=1 Tax=Acrobeloides nanus TaxID=290746 RepID=A0A914BWH6_9BILA